MARYLGPSIFVNTFTFMFNGDLNQFDLLQTAKLFYYFTLEFSYVFKTDQQYHLDL